MYGGTLESFEVSRVLTYKSGVAEPALVRVADAFVSATRKHFLAERAWSCEKDGERKRCFTT
jgi:hypothetical protein